MAAKRKNGEYVRDKLPPAIKKFYERNKMTKALLRPYRNKTVKKFYKQFGR